MVDSGTVIFSLAMIGVCLIFLTLIGVLIWKDKDPEEAGVLDSSIPRGESPGGE